MPSAMLLFECFYNGLYFYGQWRSYQWNDSDILNVYWILLPCLPEAWRDNPWWLINVK